MSRKRRGQDPYRAVAPLKKEWEVTQCVKFPNSAFDSGKLLSNVTLTDSPGTNSLIRKLNLYDNVYSIGVSTVSAVAAAYSMYV
jgi:hypothetical protein